MLRASIEDRPLTVAADLDIVQLGGVQIRESAP
jgi:hypothetical protein